MSDAGGAGWAGQVAKKKREDIGVELYGVQQQLAKIQLTLERTHDNYNLIRTIREQVGGRAWVTGLGFAWQHAQHVSMERERDRERERRRALTSPGSTCFLTSH